MTGLRTSSAALVAAVLAIPALVVAGVHGQAAQAEELVGSVSLVVGAPGALTPGDAAVAARLEGAGYDVVLSDDNTVTVADVAATTFAIITSSVTDTVLASRLASASKPLWVAKPYLFDNYGLTGPTGEVDYGSRSTRTIAVVAPDHPLAAGRTGTVNFQTGSSRVTYARAASAATVVARIGSDATILTIAAGMPLANGQPAPGCRMSFPLFANAPTTFTADGWAMFDAAAQWAAGGCATAPVDAPPTVMITAPAGGASVSGTTTVTATATDDVGVTSVGFAIDGAAIGTDSNAADGWSTSWDTTAVPDGSHVVSATATDTAGQTSTTSHSVTVANAPPSDTVLFVVAAPATLTPGEAAVRSRLLGTGYQVVIADDGAVTAADTSGKAFALVSSGVDSTTFGTRLRTVPIPVWIAKPYLFDDYGLTGTRAGIDYESKVATSVTITAAGHRMAAGRTGTVQIQTGNNRVSWGRPAASATVVAQAGSDATIFTIPAGAPLANGQSAAGCRLTFPLFNNAPTTFTADGWAMFEATAGWAADGCADDDPPPPPGGVEHVILVSVDGLNPAAITQLGPSGAPTFYRLMAEGASTLNARTTVERTQTLPNHSSMASGRKVDLPGGHGVTFNEDPGTTIHTAAGQYVASVFDVVHDTGGSTGLFAGKEKFAFYDRSWAATTGAPDTTGVDNGRDKIDSYIRASSSSTTTTLVGELASTPRDFTFVHFHEVDTTGHASGWLSPEYLAAVTAADTQLDRILDAVAADADLAARTVVIVTADHGGVGLFHSDPALADNYTVPLFVWGAGVDASADLYALNPDRLDPGSTQPAYTAPVQPIRTGEVANLVTDLLDLGAVPGSGFNVNQSLDVGTP